MIRCVRCYQSFTLEQVEHVQACPSCGAKGLPMDTDHDTKVIINTHELRILGIWAENYAVSIDNQHLDDPSHESLKETVAAICGRLEAQLAIAELPTALTLSREFEELKKAHPDAQLFRGGHEEP